MRCCGYLIKIGRTSGDWRAKGLRYPTERIVTVLKPTGSWRLAHLGVWVFVILFDTQLFGDEGMEIMARQLYPHMVGRQDFKDGSGVTIFELISADVAGRALREGAAADYRVNSKRAVERR